MKLLMRSCGQLSGKALALAMGAGVVVSAFQVAAFADGPVAPGQPCPTCAVPPRPARVPDPRAPIDGKVPHGEPFYGFGLGYFPGIGYGGAGLGVNPNGGYPYYGGPGYPACNPVLRRFGPITPFPYYGGLGYPTAAHPNFFGGIGPLMPDEPVITFEPDSRDAGYTSGYGGYTGSVPDAERLFAPFTLEAAFSGSTSGVISPVPAMPSPPAAPVPPVDPLRSPASPPSGAIPNGSAHGLPLGMEEEAATDATGVRGIKVVKVYPGSEAEKAGLHVGDMIVSINGYQTVQPGNLTWVIASAAPDKVLTMNVRTANDNKEQIIKAQLP